MGRKRVVHRDPRTGRFAKALTPAGRPRKVLAQEVAVSEHEVEVARGRRGRFVKRETARRHPDRTTTERLVRGRGTEDFRAEVGTDDEMPDS